MDEGFDCHPLAIPLASEHHFDALGSSISGQVTFLPGKRALGKDIT